jgi:hypothetical protein
MARLPLFADTPPELTVRALREVRPDRSQDGKTWRASLVDVHGSTGDVDIQVSGTNEHRVRMTPDFVADELNRKGWDRQDERSCLEQLMARSPLTLHPRSLG